MAKQIGLRFQVDVKTMKIICLLKMAFEQQRKRGKP